MRNVEIFLMFAAMTGERPSSYFMDLILITSLYRLGFLHFLTQIFMFVEKIRIFVLLKLIFKFVEDAVYRFSDS